MLEADVVRLLGDGLERRHRGILCRAVPVAAGRSRMLSQASLLPQKSSKAAYLAR